MLNTPRRQPNGLFRAPIEQSRGASPAVSIRRSDFYHNDGKGRALMGKGQESLSEYSGTCIDMHADSLLISAESSAAQLCRSRMAAHRSTHSSGVR